MNDKERLQKLRGAVEILFNYSLDVTVNTSSIKDSKKRGKLHEYFFQLNQKAKEMRMILDKIDYEINKKH